MTADYRSNSLLDSVQLDFFEGLKPAPRPVAEPKQEKSRPPNPETKSTAGYARLLEILRRGAKRPVALKLNQNRGVWMSIRPARNGAPVRISLHEEFLKAPADVIEAVASLVNGDRRHSHRLIQAYIDQASSSAEHVVRGRSGRRRFLRPRGRHYDLRRIMAELRAEYFDGREFPPISWGRSRRLGRHVTLGSYCDIDKMIRIHPVLDDERAPEYFVRFVVFHEMLHHLYPVRRGPSGRRIVHSAEFHRHERRFAEYAAAMKFEKELFKKLGRRRTTVSSEQ